MPLTAHSGGGDGAASSSNEEKESSQSLGQDWLQVLDQPCSFSPEIFEAVSLNLLKNPNINSSLLFRADILFDSKDELTDDELPVAQREALLEAYTLPNGELPGFTVERTVLRRMIPRNPQLDKPILQTCLLLKSSKAEEPLQTLVIYIPHADTSIELPWYHPRVQSLAYLHIWSRSGENDHQGLVSLHFRLFASESLPLSTRLERTAHHLLMTIVKHGNGRMEGYEKRVHHDQLISQQRLQRTYSELKRKHSQRLCDRWVENTQPTKHVFEDLGIAAFLIEIWRDMYGTRPYLEREEDPDDDGHEDEAFPGFVDIGCGNGILVDVLFREGYSGWGFDARKRKSWSTFDFSIQNCLEEMILVPSPLQSPRLNQRSRSSSASNIIHSLSNFKFATRHQAPTQHDGIFPQGTFIISNHADELTPWTPLLASLSMSPFLCIPCCSHNLSGSRFRAPSVFNNNTADAFAPSYFKNYISTSKAIPLMIAHSDNDEMYSPGDPDGAEQGTTSQKGAESGDLKLMAAQRKKQPSAYSSLCDWVGNLAASVGYEVEKEMLRLPTTRNVGLVGRTWRKGFEDETENMRRQRVEKIVKEEKADGQAWKDRAKSLMAGQGCTH